MELSLSLGETTRPLSYKEEPRETSTQSGLGLNTTLSIGPVSSKHTDQHQEELQTVVQRNKHKSEENHEDANESLLSPFLKANNKPDLHPHFSSGGSSRGLDVNMPPAKDEAEEEEAALSSSPNSAAALIDLCMFSRKESISGEGNYDNQRGYGTSRASDEDEKRSSTRKRLRLSKEQSSFLEESFKDHNTLNPKQKSTLARELHLRPRQVEVWFQNRRARTKLKKIELDCEYLKRICDTLTEENTRLHKELQELRSLKTWHHQHCQN